MKNAKIIYKLIQIMLLFTAMGIVAGFVVLLLTVFGIETNLIDISIKKTLVEDKTILITVFLLLIPVYAIFLFGLLKLRIAIKNLLNKKYFAEPVTKNFSLAGKAFVLAAVYHWFFTGMVQLLTKHEFFATLSEKTIVYIFGITIGLLLMLISEVLDNARKLKEENDLIV